MAHTAKEEEEKMLTYLVAYLRSLLAPLSDEKGQDLAEYALLIALIALIAIAAVTFMGQQISTVLSTIGSVLSSALT